MKFIGGEDLSEQERQRIVDTERQRRWMRYALMAKRDLISLIHRRRREYGQAPGGDIPPLGHRTGPELAEILTTLEDEETARKEQTDAPGNSDDRAGHGVDVPRAGRGVRPV